MSTVAMQATKARLTPALPLCEVGAPLTWLLTGDRPGDNSQILSLARAAGLGFEVKPIVPPGGSRRRGRPKRFDRDQLDRNRSACLEPPWPDLIITAGHWPTAAALWVQHHSRGQTKLVLIGRPRPEHLRHFALVLVPSHYCVPDHPRVRRVDFPPVMMDRDEIARAAIRWQQRFEKLARPLTAVFVGGQTKPFRLDVSVAKTLAKQIRRLLEEDGGSAYLVTSPRTDALTARALARYLPESTLFDFPSGAATDNPYCALLGCADRFVVTGDSVSMLVEVASLGRPLAIFGLPKTRTPGARPGFALRKWLSAQRSSPTLNALSIHAHRLCGIGFPRDIEALHERLYSRGLAVPLGRPILPPKHAFEAEIEEIASLIRGLLPAQAKLPAAVC